MPRQASPAITSLGQPSDATVQLGAARNNRVLAAMQAAAALQQQALQEAGATQRTGMQVQGATQQAQIGEAGATQRTAAQIKGQSAIAGMQEAGATGRAQLGEEGANSRAGLSAQVAREGQQGQIQMNQAGIDANDRQQAAQIRATREENDLRSRADADNQERLLAMQDKWKQADMAFEQDKWDQGVEFAYMGREDQQVQSVMDFVETVTNGRMLMGMLQKQLGREEYQARTEDLRDKYVKGYTASTNVSAAKDRVLDEFFSVRTGTVAGNVDKVFLEATTQQQMPTDMDFFSSANRPALESVVQGWTPVEFHTAYKTLEIMENKLLEEREKVPKKVSYTAAILGKESPNVRNVKQINLDLKKVMNARRVLDGELPNSKTPMPGAAGTVGKHVNSLWQSYQGLTLEAAQSRSAELYPDDPNGFSQDALGVINGQDDLNALLRMAGPMMSNLTPEAQSRVIAAIRATYGPLFAPSVPAALAGASSGTRR